MTAGSSSSAAVVEAAARRWEGEAKGTAVEATIELVCSRCGEGAVLVFLNDSPFQCFISPFESEILTGLVRASNGTDYRVLDVSSSGDGLVGRVAGHRLGPGDHVLTLKLVHPGSVRYDVDRRQVWLEHEDLQLMGIDHKRLTYRFNGRDYRLTDVAGEVIEALLA